MDSKHQREIAMILPRMLEFSDSRTISERVFSALCRYPGKKRRNSLLTSISHCRISFYQLQEICKQKICVEAFAALLDMYISYDIFSLDDLKKLCSENETFVCTINFRSLINEGITSLEKKEFAEAMEKKCNINTYYSS